MAYSGKLCVFAIEDSTPGTFVSVLSAKSNGFTINHSTVDSSTKADNGWSSSLPGGGITSFDVTLDGVFLNSTLDKKMRGFGVSGESFAGKLITGNGDSFTGNFICTSMDVSGSFDGIEGYSFKIVNDGVIVFATTP